MKRPYKNIEKRPSSERLLLFFDFCNYLIGLKIITDALTVIVLVSLSF